MFFFTQPCFLKNYIPSGWKWPQNIKATERSGLECHSGSEQRRIAFLKYYEKFLMPCSFFPSCHPSFYWISPPPYFFPTPLFISFLIGKTNQRALNLNLVFKAPKHKWIRDQIQLINTSSDRNHLWLSSFKFLHDFLLRNTAVVFHLLFLSRLFFHLSLMIQTTVTPMKPTQLY